MLFKAWPVAGNFSYNSSLSLFMDRLGVYRGRSTRVILTLLSPPHISKLASNHPTIQPHDSAVCIATRPPTA